MKSFLCALSTLTRIPVGKHFSPSDADIRNSADYFPFIGLLLALVLTVFACALEKVLPNPLFMFILPFLGELPTGAFHLDGLADTADGFMSSRSRERILEIMHDSRIGTMGVLAIVVWAFLRFGCFFTTAKGVFPTALFCSILYGRCALVYHLAFCQYARKEGLGRLVFERKPIAGLWFAFVFSCIMVMVSPGFLWCLPPLLLPLWVWLWSAYCTKKIGGGTGDTLGACEEITEILVLFWFACVSA